MITVNYKDLEKRNGNNFALLSVSCLSDFAVVSFYENGKQVLKRISISEIVLINTHESIEDIINKPVIVMPIQGNYVNIAGILDLSPLSNYALVINSNGHFERIKLNQL